MLADGAAPAEDTALVQHILYDLNTGDGGPLILNAGDLDSGTDSGTLTDVGTALAASCLSLLEVLSPNAAEAFGSKIG